MTIVPDHQVFANNTCILSGHTGAGWCNSEGCGALNFRDMCPKTSANLSIGTAFLNSSYNRYYAPRGNATWRSSNQRCGLSIADVQARGQEQGSEVYDVATLSAADIVAQIEALLW